MATLRKTLQHFNSARGASGAPSTDRGKEVNPQQVSSIADDDFSGKGVDLNVKYYGKCVVTEPRGEKVAHGAMRDLKQQLLASSGHKQRVTVNLSMFGVMLYEDRRVREIAKHAVKAISFMTIDPEDTKVFSYIAAEGPDEEDPVRVFRLYCFKSEKQTPLITKSMMRIFKLAHDEKKRQVSQKGKGGSSLSRRGTTKDSESDSGASTTSTSGGAGSVLNFSPTSPAQPRLEQGRRAMLASAPNLVATTNAGNGGGGGGSSNTAGASSKAKLAPYSPDTKSSKSTSSLSNSSSNASSNASTSPAGKPRSASNASHLLTASSPHHHHHPHRRASMSSGASSGSLGRERRMTLQELSASATDVRDGEAAGDALEARPRSATPLAATAMTRERPLSCEVRGGDDAASTGPALLNTSSSNSSSLMRGGGAASTGPALLSSSSSSNLMSFTPGRPPASADAGSQEPVAYFPLNVVLSSPESERLSGGGAARQETGYNDLLNPCDLFATPNTLNLLGDILPPSPAMTRSTSGLAAQAHDQLTGALSGSNSSAGQHGYDSGSRSPAGSPVLGAHSYRPRARPGSLAQRLLSPTATQSRSASSSAAVTPASPPQSVSPGELANMHSPFGSSSSVPMRSQSKWQSQLHAQWARFDDGNRGGGKSGSCGDLLDNVGTQPLPPLPPGGKADESQYATLSSSVSPTRAKSIKNRESLQLMNFNSSTDQPPAEPALPPSSSSSSGGDSTYAAVNPGSKHTFSLEQFGLILSAVDDIGALPAPIGMPYKGVARNPFEEPEEPPVQPVRASTLESFDPAFGSDGGGGSAGSMAAGFDSEFPAFPDTAQGQEESQVYAVPRFPPIRAVLGDDECDDDVGRDSGDLFGS